MFVFCTDKLKLESMVGDATHSKQQGAMMSSCRRAAFDTVVCVSRMQISQPVAHTVADSRPEDSEPQAVIEGIKLGNVEVASQ